MSVISVSNVKKSFKIYYDKSPTLKEKILFQSRNRSEIHRVLKGINLEIEQGEVVGLIGENGCGKSTLLKLLTRIIYPDEGTIEIKGKVSSLLELGAGFHPDMTGRENIYTNASIFGLSRKEIDKRIDKIIEFSELGEFVDNPVRTYSSGMYMRLAFSVAINVDAEVLLIDEILAVGDANFQTKCFDKLRGIKAQGTTIVIVSHSLAQIEQLCDRSVWIQNGLIEKDGLPRDVHSEYLFFMNNKREALSAAQRQTEAEIQAEAVLEPEGETAEETPGEASAPEEKQSADRYGSKDASIVAIDSVDKDGKSKRIFRTGETVTFLIRYKAVRKIERPVVGLGFIRNDGVYSYGSNTLIDKAEAFTLDKSGVIKLEFQKFNLLPGIYDLDIALEEAVGIPLDYYKKAYQIEVYSEFGDIGVARIDHSWEIKEDS